MKQCPNQLRPRAALLIGAAFLATPAFAQEGAPQQAVTPPPAVEAPVPQAAAPAPDVRMAPSAPVVQSVPPVEQQMAGSANQAPSAADTAPAPRAAARTETRPTSQPRQVATKSQAASPETVSAPAPQPEPDQAPTADSAGAPAQPAAEVSQTNEATSTRTRSTPVLPWILGGLAVILAVGVALFLLRRRRAEDDLLVRETTTTAAPSAAPRTVPTRGDTGLAAADAAPVMVAPMSASVAEAHVEARLAEADDAVLDHVVDVEAPVANRPWLELGLRPLRAGTSEDEALVDIELTVGNAGDTPARDVRISTFLLADAEPNEMERLLTSHGPAAEVPPVTIDVGGGTRVDAHLAVPKGEIGRTFNPVVIAEASYRLADGREGRTSAAFRIGRAAPAAEGVGPIGATRPHLVEDVEAELLGTPTHA